MSEIIDAVSIRVTNIGRKQRRDELRPQVAAAIYAGYLNHPMHVKAPRESLMDIAIIDADILLLKLYPVLPEVESEHS